MAGILQTMLHLIQTEINTKPRILLSWSSETQMAQDSKDSKDWSSSWCYQELGQARKDPPPNPDKA